MSIFNADGSEPAMCGNGIRCLASYIFKLNSSHKVVIETQQAVLRCHKVGEDVAVDLGPPTTIHWPLLLKDREIYVVDTGVPHAVIFVEDLDQVLLEEEGRSLRMDPQFAPHGVNVNFVKRVENHKLAIRTYERGVEGETLACGTGAAAAAFVAMKAKPSDSSVSVLTRSSFETSPFTYQEKMGFSLLDERIEMKGSAVEVFRGEIEI
jgi:diaminopimelate epimerase